MAAEAMDDLGDRFAHRGVTSIFIYTREAHPGEHYGHHTSMQDKRDHARAFAEHSAVRRRILIDDLAGSCHRAYGLLPNMTWIIGPGGIIYYKACWTDAGDVEDALSQTLDHFERRRGDQLVSFYSERLAWRQRDQDAFRAGLDRAGPQAVTDFYGDE